MLGCRSWPLRAHAVASALLAGGVLAGGVLAGCARPAPASHTSLTTCGVTRTAAGVPVQIEVQSGVTRCSAALAVERAYEQALAAGKVPGNGGGAPVRVRGWLCQGFNTPQLLASGKASACKRDGAEILAVLASPGSATPSP